MHILTRDLESARYTFTAGMPLPRRLDTPNGRRYMRQSYGEDCIMELDPANPKAYLDLIGAGTSIEKDAQIVQLRETVENQAKEIRDLRHENQRLKKAKGAVDASN